MKVYELPLARSYVSHWGLVEAVREILQNALDSESPFEYRFDGDTLEVTSRYTALPASTLLLGQTSKAGRTDKIGSFGEGYKIALLVLAREGRRIEVRNGGRLWMPTFRRSETFGADVLCIEETELAPENEGLTFSVGPLTDDEIEAIKDSCLHMQDDVGERMITSRGRILRERPGMLYVNGLFVCKTGLHFGYDAKPDHLRLERDRQTVSGFDLKWLAKDMWLETGRFDEIAELLDEKCPDLEFVNHGAPRALADACAKRFDGQYAGRHVVMDQNEVDEVSRNHRPYAVHSYPTYVSLIRSSPLYDTRRTELKPKPSPAAVLRAFFAEHRPHMRRRALAAFKGLLKEAELWQHK